MSDQADYTNPQVEEAWLRAKRTEIESHLGQSGAGYGGVSDWPVWFAAPITSVWGIESLVSPGFVGWWAIAGDHPPDCISSQNHKDPRSALRAICDRWGEALAAALQDGPSAGVAERENLHGIAFRLKAQIAAVRACVENDALWVVSEGGVEDGDADAGADGDGDG